MLLIFHVSTMLPILTLRFPKQLVVVACSEVTCSKGSKSRMSLKTAIEHNRTQVQHPR